MARRRVGVTTSQAADTIGTTRSRIYRLFKKGVLKGKQKAPHQRIRIFKKSLKKVYTQLNLFEP